MQNKYTFYCFLGILTGMIIIPVVFKWLGIPGFDRFLQMILGEPNTLTRLLAALLTIAPIYIIYKFPNFKKKSV
ncbi:hypothetical protein [Ureibacillus sp. GCM10028918]|uniref:hypothetical protein n=1 Tax=Ureibacillus sp. GCM10028918 TaxID=3273429 RepID=UPI0036092988